MDAPGWASAESERVGGSLVRYSRMCVLMQLLSARCRREGASTSSVVWLRRSLDSVRPVFPADLRSVDSQCTESGRGTLVDSSFVARVR